MFLKHPDVTRSHDPTDTPLLQKSRDHREKKAGSTKLLIISEREAEAPQSCLSVSSFRPRCLVNRPPRVSPFFTQVISRLLSSFFFIHLHAQDKRGNMLNKGLLFLGFSISFFSCFTVLFIDGSLSCKSFGALVKTRDRTVYKDHSANCSGRIRR